MVGRSIDEKVAQLIELQDQAAVAAEVQTVTIRTAEPGDAVIIIPREDGWSVFHDPSLKVREEQIEQLHLNDRELACFVAKIVLKDGGQIYIDPFKMPEPSA